MAKKLNFRKPYAKLIGDKKAAYSQGDKFFDKKGELVGDAPNQFCKKPKAAKKSESAESAESRDEVLERAERVAGNLDNVDALPAEVADAQRENAEALQAEENAQL